jgi:quinol-cytochrome oxidoreductase complex cytochrome b subunit
MRGPVTRPPAGDSAHDARPRTAWHTRQAPERSAREGLESNLLLHWFPARVSRASFSWSYSAWLGTVAGALFLLLLLSGLPLLFLYVPSVERAYQSMKDIEYVVTYGRWIRAVHRIAAQLMVIAAVLHLARVFVTGAYKNGLGQSQHREWNWLIGVAMLLVTLALAFTGYLLPWDQLAYWAVTVGTSIVSSVPAIGSRVREVIIGGRTIGQTTLVRFYALHVLVLPAAFGALFAYHMWRIRRDGGLAAADAVTEDLPVDAVRGLLFRALTVAIGTFAGVSILASAIPSPLGAPANPLVTLNPAKAPWYFLWLQEIVTDTTIRLGAFRANGALVGGILLPGLLLGLVTAWPWLDGSSAGTAGRWFAKSRRTQNVAFIAVLAVILALTCVALFMRGPYWDLYWPWEAWPEMPSRI